MPSCLGHGVPSCLGRGVPSCQWDGVCYSVCGMVCAILSGGWCYSESITHEVAEAGFFSHYLSSP